MATRWIKLKRSISDYIGNVTQGIRIRVEVDSALNMDTKIFRYLMRDVNPLTGAREGQFDGVASPVDIEEMPADDPGPVADPAWFRLDYVDVVLPSRKDALEFWDDLFEDVCGLKDTYDRMDTFDRVNFFACGTIPVSSSSSSSASSESLSESSSSSSSSMAP